MVTGMGCGHNVCFKFSDSFPSIAAKLNSPVTLAHPGNDAYPAFTRGDRPFTPLGYVLPKRWCVLRCSLDNPYTFLVWLLTTRFKPWQEDSCFPVSAASLGGVHESSSIKKKQKGNVWGGSMQGLWEFESCWGVASLGRLKRETRISLSPHKITTSTSGFGGH